MQPTISIPTIPINLTSAALPSGYWIGLIIQQSEKDPKLYNIEWIISQLYEPESLKKCFKELFILMKYLRFRENTSSHSAGDRDSGPWLVDNIIRWVRREKLQGTTQITGEELRREHAQLIESVLFSPARLSFGI